MIFYKRIEFPKTGSNSSRNTTGNQPMISGPTKRPSNHRWSRSFQKNFPSSSPQHTIPQKAEKERKPIRNFDAINGKPLFPKPSKTEQASCTSYKFRSKKMETDHYRHIHEIKRTPPFLQTLRSRRNAVEQSL
jgi:hypothetical protein